MKRSVKLNGVGKELEIKKVSCVKLEHSKKEFIFFEKMDGDEWRLTYTEKTIPEIQELTSLEIIRK